ncbi:MAG: hypothetical protein KDJ27_19785 [Gammaproteobacteria bacterium]|nr:hypothetical protein [Gammaproteobacteria bacterium]
MKSKIISKAHGVEIRISEANAHADRLVAAFRECQQGTCSCPTQEYRKVDSMTIAQSHDGIVLSVEAKADEQIDVAEIERCLEHTKKRVT